MDRIGSYLSNVRKDSSQPAKRRRYDAAFRTEALRLAGESRSTQADARALNISPKLLYKWQKEALIPVAEGKPTSTHLAERIISEAQTLLLHTSWSVAEIAHSLGYEYPAYLTNYFKKRTGTTPTAVRERDVTVEAPLK